MQESLIVLRLVLNALGQSPNISTVDERKRLQKAIYLAQISGADMGYRFNWYVKGPYSPTLAKDYYLLAEHEPALRDADKKWALPSSLMSRLHSVRPLHTPPPDAPLSQPNWLELVASLHFLRHVSRMSEGDARKEVAARKPLLSAYTPQAERALRNVFG